MKKLIVFLVLISGLGFTLTAGNGYHEFREKTHPTVYNGNRADIDLFNKFSFGFSNMLPDDSFPSLNMSRSFAFSMDMLSADVSINWEGSFLFHTALNWSFENYVNDDDAPFVNIQSSIFENPLLSADCYKAKMRADYLGIAVGLAFQAEDFRIYANIIPEMLTASITKAKYDDGAKFKEKIKGFNQLCSSVEGGISYDLVGFFVRYRFTPSFKSSTSLQDQNVLTVGLTLNI